MAKFLGYSSDRLGDFKEMKKKIFHEKNGWFVQREDTSLNMSSTINTTACAEFGTMMALDDLFSSTSEKLQDLRRTRKLYNRSDFSSLK